MKKYFVLVFGEDGPYCNYLSAEQLQKYLKEDWQGYEFLTAPPRDIMNTKSGTLFIICGDVIVPKPVEKVIEYEL